LVWRTGEVPSLGVEFGVVGGSSTHAVDEVEMRGYGFIRCCTQMLNSSREWQIGCAEQTMIATRGDKFVIGHEASKNAPCRSVSLAMRPQRMPLIGGLCLVQRTLTTKGFNDLPLIGGLCLVQWTSTTKGLNDLPLVGGLCLVQRTSTARGLNDLPLIGGLCLVQRTLTTKGLNDLPLIGGLCLVPMTDFDHDRSQDTNRSKPKDTAVQARHLEDVLP
jgi:hypothetical protein